jgi:ribonuclease BN (tRNA processing enzyme)
MEVTFLGTGDAFGSGGRLQTSALVRTAAASFLVDCGPSTLAAMRGRGLDPSAIDVILLTHLHGDHFGGVPFFVMDAHYASGRVRPLVVAGPPGLEARIRRAHEVLFPGTGHLPVKFPLAFVELELDLTWECAPMRVTPYPAAHSSGAPSYSLRIECDGRVLAFSGDTEWTEALIPASRDADLFVCECYGFDRSPAHHLNYRVIRAHQAEFTCRRLLLTHMGDAMLKQAPALDIETTCDGMIVKL